MSITVKFTDRCVRVSQLSSFLCSYNLNTGLSNLTEGHYVRWMVSGRGSKYDCLTSRVESHRLDPKDPKLLIHTDRESGDSPSDNLLRDRTLSTFHAFPVPETNILVRRPKYVPILMKIKNRIDQRPWT